MPFLDDLLSRFNALNPSDLKSFLRSLDEERITFYPTYGYRDGDRWRIPLRIWASELREKAAEALAKKAAEVLEGLAQIGKADDMGAAGEQRILERLTDIVADDEGKQEVEFRFDGDPEERAWRLEDDRGEPLETDRNGVAEGEISISVATAQELLQRQGSEDGWLTFRTVSRGHTGEGRVRLIGPEGLSVISDIDDTIKVTEIPRGLPRVLYNTFAKEFEAAEGVREQYRALGTATAFHYVSGSPYQLFGPLSGFLHSPEAGYPWGSYHMRPLGKNPKELGTWQGLAGLVVGGSRDTFERKVAQISQILEHFSRRRFILIGDSGECDPEVYREVRERIHKQRPGQVAEIWIRDVTGEGPDGRLAGMRHIQADDLGESGCEVNGSG